MFFATPIFSNDSIINNVDKFASEYFLAWSASQSPTATKTDIETYLEFLTDDVGHQHLPYDVVADRKPDGKTNMREGMTYYLGAHSEYKAKLLSIVSGYNVIVIKYYTFSKGIHPQTGKVIELSYDTVEVLEIEKGKISVIQKYSQ